MTEIQLTEFGKGDLVRYIGSSAALGFVVSTQDPADSIVLVRWVGGELTPVRAEQLELMEAVTPAVAKAARIEARKGQVRAADKAAPEFHVNDRVASRAIGRRKGIVTAAYTDGKVRVRWEGAEQDTLVGRARLYLLSSPSNPIPWDAGTDKIVSGDVVITWTGKIGSVLHSYADGSVDVHLDTAAPVSLRRNQVRRAV